MPFATWITFVVAASIIAVSPGSGAVLSMSHGLSYGVQKASATILGLQLGLLVVLGIAGAGVGSLLLASEVAFNIVKTVGALYLIYLGLSQWRAKVARGRRTACRRRGAVLAPALADRFPDQRDQSEGHHFHGGGVAAIHQPCAPLLPQLLILAVTMCCIDLIVMHSYAFLASSMQRFFRDAGAVKKQNRVFGGLLMAVGAALFFVKRGGQAAS